MNDQAADGVGFFAAVFRAEKALMSSISVAAWMRQRSEENGVDIVGAVVFVKLVFDVADDLL